MLHGGDGCFVENRQATGFVKNFQQCDYSFVALLPGRKGPDALRKTLEKVDFHDLMESRRHVLLAGNDRQAVPLCHCEQQTGYSGVRRRHEYIGAYAFADLKNPAVIYMPAGEISIDDAAFEGSSVTLVCTAGSPAAKWAEEHGTEVILIARERT